MTISKIFSSRLIIALLLTGGLFVSSNTFAMDLNSAKHQGYVGEQTNGYLGMAGSHAPAEAKALMQDINNKRKTHYENIAKRNNISVSEVAKLTAKKIIDKASRGHYIQNSGGDWVKK